MRKTLQLGGCGGHVPPENFWDLEAMKLLKQLFLAQYDASQRPDNSFTCMNIYPFCPLHRTALTWFRLSDRLLISQTTSFTDKACKTNHFAWKSGKLLEENSEEFFALFAAISQASTCHLCALGVSTKQWH